MKGFAMRVGDLPIPGYLREIYARRGIDELYPPQAECIRKGLLEGRNILLSVPTASGKTLVAEIAMHHHISRGGKCLYIVPLKALASEKYEEFSGKNVRVGISTGDFDRRDEYLGRNDIIVATSEKVDSLIRNRAHWIPSVTLLVVDEVHLIDEPRRGPTLEMVIAKMRAKNANLQIIALSATIGNPGTLAGWLGAEVVSGTWRPVELRQGIYCDGRIRFGEGCREVPAVSRNEDVNLVLDTVSSGGQCLVFVSSRRNAEAFAKRAASALKCADAALGALGDQIKGAAATADEEVLASCVARGAAFHHAGLSREARALVEDGFRRGLIKCIACTPTLAAGLNLPARRVIVRDFRRYEAGLGMVPIPAREYHQMAGRAGRPGLDPYGEAILIAGDEAEAGQLREYYIESPPENVNSRCDNDSVLTAQILSLVASGFARTHADLLQFLSGTFYHYQHGKRRTMGGLAERALQFLERAGMITRLEDHLAATEYGNLVSLLYIDPRGAEAIVSGMSRAREYSDVALLQLICTTPDMFCLYVGQRDLPPLERYLLESGDDLWATLEPGEEETFFRALKTALVLEDWIEEKPLDLICERFSIGAGDLHALVESSNWLLHAAARLSALYAPRFTREVQVLETRVKHGVKRELVPLVQVRNIGRVRARSLYTHGIRSPEEILAADPRVLASILGRGVAQSVLRELSDAGQGREDGPAEAGEAAGESPAQSRLDAFHGGT
ncbi:MAG: ATP-dependent DNA helicase [Methanolinea sp.]|nr:ATP-dependent DNA helicase [Methanolinea sp.]